MYQARMKAVLKEMTNTNTPELLVTDPVTIFYLTGEMIHPGERLLVLIIKASGSQTLVVNRLFPLEEINGVNLVYYDDTEDGVAVVAKHLSGNGKLGIDKNWPAQFLLRLMPLTTEREYVLGSKITDDVRAIKSGEEIELMRQASKSNDGVMAKVKATLPQELTELEMAEKMVAFYAEDGNSGFSFDPIVAYGGNGADPHHGNDDSTLKVGDSIIIDIGGVKNDYCSDMTRTFFYKEVSERNRDVYETVLEAGRRAIATVKPGVTFAEIDAAARDYITKKGYGEYFTHRTGHFIGLECHETGDVSGANHAVVEAGMIFSIEPGIYLPGEVGVRIEDLIVATESGHENLNHFPKELTIIGA